jgi:hypothetical protein
LPYQILQTYLGRPAGQPGFHIRDAAIPRRDGLIHFIETGGDRPHRFEAPEPEP